MDAEVERIFTALNLAMAGERFEDAIKALKDLVAASCCVAGNSVSDALKIADLFHVDTIGTIMMNYDHYRKCAAQDVDRAAGRS